MEKRGVMRKNIIQLVLLALVIGLIFLAAMNAVSQAEGTSSKRAFAILFSHINEENIDPLWGFYLDSGWVIKGFNSGTRSSPNTCENYSCLCLCKKNWFNPIAPDCTKKGICKITAKNVLMDTGKLREPIQINSRFTDLFFTYNGAIILSLQDVFDKEQEVINIPKINIDQAIVDNKEFTLGIIPLIPSSNLIGVEQKYNFDSVRLTKALIKQESSGNAHAISSTGAAGLIQLMPLTAEGLGLKVWHDPDGYSKRESSLTLAESNKKYSELLKQQYEGNKFNLLKTDERFDPVKNVEAGTRYLAKKITEFNDLKLGLAAYYAGTGGVKKRCIPLRFRNCSPSVQKYVEGVLRHYENIPE